MGSSFSVEEPAKSIARFHQKSDGGYAGGPSQLSHLAATYASVMALMVTELSNIDTEGLLKFFLSLKQPDGSFIMHQGGEVDVRGSYCVISVAYLCNILTPELTNGVAEFVSKCQTYEGGFGGVPFAEAHGGYSFCSFATLCILKRFDMINLHSLERWLLRRQLNLEGGFQGRTNKLVDGCYSYWQGAIFSLLSFAKRCAKIETKGDSNDWLDREKLTNFILSFCQVDSGGFCDRKGNRSDFYHTCYCLAGLSVACHKIDVDQIDYGKVDVVVVNHQFQLVFIPRVLRANFRHLFIRSLGSRYRPWEGP